MQDRAGSGSWRCNLRVDPRKNCSGVANYSAVDHIGPSSSSYSSSSLSAAAAAAKVDAHLDAHVESQLVVGVREVLLPGAVLRSTGRIAYVAV